MTCISCRNLKDKISPLAYVIPIAIYREMGFIAKERAETWGRAPVAGQSGISGKEFRKNHPVTIIEDGDGYFRIENPDSADWPYEKVADLWLRDTLANKFPE